MPSKKASTKVEAVKSDDAGSFESSLVDLKQIISDLEGGELELTESLQRYEQGIRRLRECHQFLKSAEQRISQLVGVDAEGNPVLETVDKPDTEGLAEKQQARQSRRSAKTSPLGGSNGGQLDSRRGTRPPAKESVDDSPELF